MGPSPLVSVLPRRTFGLSGLSQAADERLKMVVYGAADERIELRDFREVPQLASIERGSGEGETSDSIQKI